MPNIVNFDGRQIIEPGVYSQIRGNVPSPAVVGTFGNVFLIDTGSQGTGIGQTKPAFGNGSGISGELFSGGDAVYQFTSAVDFKRFVRGGQLYDLIDYLMSPTLNGLGPTRIYHARAATTTAPAFTFTFPTSAGAVKIQAKCEGETGNGSLVSGVLTRGYGCKIKAGIVNTSAFIIEFYEGQFRGTGEDGLPYDGIYENTITTNYIVARSIEFTTAAQLIAWMQSDNAFNQYFALSATGTTTSGTTIASSVLTTYAAVQVFSGGTTTYSLAALQALLDTIADVDNSMFLCDDYGVTPTTQTADVQGGCNKGGLSTFNQAIVAHVKTQATFGQKAVYIGGGQDSTQYTTGGSDGSKNMAVFYNSELTTVVHSAVKVPSTVSNQGLNYKYLNSFYHAALVCGRIAGLNPEIPGTYKDLRIIGLKHEMKKSEREQALLAGVLHVRFVQGLGWVINQAINTKQTNAALIYNDGTSPEISVMRIIHQLNKELKLSANTVFTGGNIGTINGDDIKLFTESYLQQRTASTLVSNLIIASEHKVTTVYDNGAWKVTYCFCPNLPVNQTFFTGYAVDPSLAIAAA